jgi:hypothetical protein
MMTMRERILAVIHGRPVDRVPLLQYDGLVAPNEDVWAVVGRRNVGIIRWSQVHKIVTPNCRWVSRERTQGGRRIVTSVLTTPAGELIEESIHNPEEGASGRSRYAVREEADYRVLAAYIRDMQVVEDFDAFRRDETEVGQDGLAMVKLEKTPYQRFWVVWVGLENLCRHLADESPGAAECMELWAGICRRVQGVVEKALDCLDIHYVNFPDNISAPLIGRKYFAEYCLPFYREMGDLLSAHGLPTFSHMDGRLRSLREEIARSGISGLDSFTPPPEGDVSVAEAMAWWPEMRLFVNFPASVHLLGDAEVRRVACAIMEQGGRSGRLALQFSEDLAPGVWRRSLPVILDVLRSLNRQ